MKNAKQLLTGFVMGVALLAGTFVPASRVEAADKIVLKDGRVIEGRIVKELDGYFWLEETMGGIKQSPKMYKPDEIDKVEREDAAGAKGGEAKAAAVKSDPGSDKPLGIPAKIGSGVPKGAVITLGDEENGNMVGVYMVAHILHDALPVLEKELGNDRSGIVVLRFHSGGGYTKEVQELSDVIHNEYKPRFRTVGWIETAISAAAMSAHCIEEIYFTSQGNYGACTEFTSLQNASEGFRLEQILAKAEGFSRRGGWDTKIMRSMQVQDPLSAKIDENGTVQYFNDLTSGDIIVNRAKEILTFNANSAKQVKFSRGTADSLEELAHLMGYQEIDWIGQKMDKVPWPVSKAEKMQMDYRKKVHEDESATNRYFSEFQRNIETARSTPRDRRAPFVGLARQAKEKIVSMVKNNPNFEWSIFGRSHEGFKELVDEWEKALRDLMR